MFFTYVLKLDISSNIMKCNYSLQAIELMKSFSGETTCFLLTIFNVFITRKVLLFKHVAVVNDTDIRNSYFLCVT